MLNYQWASNTGQCGYSPMISRSNTNVAHEGHHGINKTKSLLPETVWFPGIDKMVKIKVPSSIPCMANHDPKRREPLKMTELPSHPWQKVGTDFDGSLPSGDYLLVVQDGYSRFPEVEILRSTSASANIPMIDKIFSSH